MILPIFLVFAPALMYKFLWYEKRCVPLCIWMTVIHTHLYFIPAWIQSLKEFPKLLSPFFSCLFFSFSQGKHFEDGQISGRGHKDAGVRCSLRSGQVVSGRPVFCQNNYPANRCGQTGSCQYWLWWPWDTGEPVLFFLPQVSICPFTVPGVWAKNELSIAITFQSFVSFPGWVVINLCLSSCPFCRWFW